MKITVKFIQERNEDGERYYAFLDRSRNEFRLYIENKIDMKIYEWYEISATILGEGYSSPVESQAIHTIITDVKVIRQVEIE
ncbi:gp622 [Bacillus phage G]|uniref:Gp622 n=1 Tax=Bacillus phage G TaxID=2884420 RepID=G3MB02_9CAUD|nr:gp622 [Bacillus phage G]AEO93867.1 gp622 [Bacillus phage G]